ncbi:MAG: glycosyltransferase [Planctomycetota bacterium]
MESSPVTGSFRTLAALPTSSVAAGPSRPLRCIHATSSFALGGREIRIAELINLAGGSAEHEIVALDGRTDASERIEKGIEVTYASPPGGRGPFGRIRSIRALLRVRRPDLVLTYNWGAIEWIVAAGSLGIPVVHHEDGFGPDEVEKRLRRRNAFRRFAFRSATAVIVPSIVLRSIAQDEWGQSSPRLHYLPNGVDTERFRPGDAKPVRADERLVIGCVGRLRGEKDQASAIRALARCQHRDRLRLVLVGDGPFEDEWKALAVSEGVAEFVDFRGPVRDSAPCYREFDVFAIPSKTEQMPISLLEAMATCLPIVGTDVGDVSAMLSDANRGAELLVPPGDSNALARVFDAVVELGEARPELGASNRDRVKRDFERESCFGAYLEVYRASAASGRFEAP